MFSRPVEMKKITVIFPTEYREQLISKLQEAGVVEVSYREPSRLISEYEKTRKLHEKTMDLLMRAKGITKRIELTAFELNTLTLDKIERDLLDVEITVKSLETEIENTRRQIEKLQLLRGVISKLPRTLNPRNLYYVGKRISSILIISRIDVVNNLLKDPYILSHEKYTIGGELVVLLVYLDPVAFSKYLENLNQLSVWYPDQYVSKIIDKSPTLIDLERNIDLEISILNNNIGEAEKRLRDYIQSWFETLGKYALFLENTLQKYSTLGLLLRLKHISSITGWIPAGGVENLVSLLESSGIPHVIDIRNPEPGDEPPTLMNNKPVIRFYQLITRLYGIPGYFERDPTPLIAYSFAFFFGLMNADVGYGLLGVLSTIIVLDKLTESPENQLYREFKGVLVVSNIIAIILGFLTGSIFGDLFISLFNLETLALLSTLSNPLEFIKISMIIGLLHVNIAHVLATIKYIKEKKRGELITEIGLFVTQVFGIPYILISLFKYQSPFTTLLSNDILLTGTVLGVIIVIAGSYISMKILGFLMWIFQITGLLGDVLSYVRLAGVGLATYYMATIFNYMNNLVYGYFTGLNNILGLVISMPILIVTHILVFTLSQLGAFIHSLRLCLLEFLTKFYDGNGREYNPLRVVNWKMFSIK